MSIAAQLAKGTEQLGIALDATQRERLERYLALLTKWNEVYNLTAIRDPEQMVTQHLLDSLPVLPYLSGAQTLADIGSGAGLPGIPLAVARPDLCVWLVESNHKKCAFLRQALLELGLSRVCIVQQRVEEWRPETPVDVIISRAFSDLGEFIALTRHACAPRGRFLAMKGLYPHEELAKLAPGTRVVQVAELTVPGLDAHRHLVIVEAD